jgi:hypothetical protein
MNPELAAIDAALQLQIDLIRHSNSVEAGIVSLFDDMRKELIKQLGGKELTDFKKARLNSLLKDTQATIGDYYAKAASTLGQTLNEIPGLVTPKERLAVGNLAVTINRIDEKDGLRLVNVDVAKFDALFKKSTEFYIGPGGIGARYERVKQFMLDNGTFEASNASVRENGSIVFGNGRHRYAALRDAANEVIPIAMDEESITNARNLGLLAKGDPTVATIAVEALVPSAAVLETITKTLLVEGGPADAWWKKMSLDTAFKFSNQVRQGIALGETNSQIFRRVAQMTDLAGRNSRALVHTAIMQAAGDARMAVIGQNADVYTGYRHLSTLDGHTTSICMARSGAEWDLDKEPINGNKLPFKQTPVHWNCRSTIIGILRPLSDFGLKEPKGQTRASAEGQIRKDTSFEEFLGRRTVAQQNEQLGVGRAELWRDGKITLRQLVDNSGNSLTLSQLKAKYAKP